MANNCFFCLLSQKTKVFEHGKKLKPQKTIRFNKKLQLMFRMVLVLLLGLFDIITAVIVLISGLGFEWIPFKILIIACIYLWVKAFSFRGSVTSIIDGLIGVYLILTPLFQIKALTIIIAIHLGIKGVASMVR